MAINPPMGESVLASDGENMARDVYTGTAERTYEQSSWIANTFRKPWNPDDLFQKSGDYSIYEDMANDDQVSICMQLKLDLIVGCGWDITDENDPDKAQEIKKLLEQDPEENFDDLIEQFARNQYEKGFALAEKIFFNKENNVLSLKNLKTRHPLSWQIHTDNKGNIEKYVQVGTAEGDIEIPKASLMHGINNPQYQNPYGTPDLRRCYEAWFAKRQFIRYLSIFLEKYASPIPYGKYKAGLPQDKVQDMFDILKKFQQKTALVFPDNFEVEFLQCNSNGEAYGRAIDLFNMFIGRALFVPDLLGFQGSETGGGSLALGAEQTKIFLKHIYRKRKTLEGLINKHIIYPITIWNYGLSDSYPQFKFKQVEEEKTIEHAKTFLEAVKGRLYKPSDDEIRHFQSLIKFPESETIERFEEQVVDPETGLPQKPGMGQAAKDGGKPKPGEEKKDKEVKGKKDFALKVPENYGTYYKRVDFKAVKNELDSALDELQSDLQPTIKKIFNDLLDQIEKKKVLQKPERIEDLKCKHLKELQQTFKSNFRDEYKRARKRAAVEIGTQNFRPAYPSEKFLELLDTQTFSYVGDWEAGVLKVLKPQLIAAIKDGRPLGPVLDSVEEAVEDWSDVSVERWARTTFTEVMNRGRHAEFEESGIVEAYQYSAILDDRTSDICAGLDGKIFKSGSEVIPPAHYNCRSLLIPITKFEDYEVSKSVNGQNIDAFIDKQLEITGFPRQ